VRPSLFVAVLVVVTIGASSCSETGDYSSIVSDYGPSSSEGVSIQQPAKGPKLSEFRNPSGSIYCYGRATPDSGGLACLFLDNYYSPGYIIRDSCRGHDGSKPTAYGWFFSRSDTPCWFVWGDRKVPTPDPDPATTVAYGQSAVLSSPAGDVGCLVRIFGVYCALVRDPDRSFFIGPQWMGAHSL